MRALADADRIRKFMRALGRAARSPGRVYFTGGATAVLSGWEDRSPFITREGQLSFHHFDFVAQALAKIERGHATDRQDVLEMLKRRLVTPDALRSAFETIEPEIYRYPALDPRGFKRALDDLLAHAQQDSGSTP